MMQKGKINSDVIPPRMVFHGWNKVAFEAGIAVHELRKMQEKFRAMQEYKTADRLRAIADELNYALEYVGVEFVPFAKEEG